MSSSSTLLSSFLSAISTLLSLAAEIGLLVVALTIVKPRRADAAVALAAGAVAHGFATLVWPALTTFVAPALSETGGSSSIVMVYQVTGLFLALVRATGWAAILYGIVKLANNPPPARGIPSPWS